MTEVDPTQRAHKNPTQKPFAFQMKFTDLKTNTPKMRRIERPYP